jgi:hypothetical protein
MEWLYIISTIVVLTIITFILIIFLPTPLSFFTIDDISHFLMLLEDDDNFLKITEELEKEFSEMNKTNCTKILFDGVNICVDENKMPMLFKCLRSIPDVEKVFLQYIPKKINMKHRKGSADYCNNKLRCVLPIKIPGAKKSGIWNDGETKFFVDGEWIIYDDSRENSIFNKHKRSTVYLLVVDVKRPHKIPLGIAVENHDELF